MIVSELLEKLQQLDPNKEVVITILEKLAADENWRVRYCVAEHPNTPEHIKEYLTSRMYYEQS